jgi:hypothetical protein
MSSSVNMWGAARRWGPIRQPMTAVLPHAKRVYYYRIYALLATPCCDSITILPIGDILLEHWPA